MKPMRRLLVLLLLLAAALPASLAQAEGGLALQPYWTFETRSPVTHVQAGDINGDGIPEIVAGTVDGSVYVLENSGELAWRYQADGAVRELLVADLNRDGKAETIVRSAAHTISLLRDVEKPVWVLSYRDLGHTAFGISAVDLEGDGQHELLAGFGGSDWGIDLLDAEKGTFLDSYVIPRPVISVWAGDVNNDGRPEIVASPQGGSGVNVYEGDGREVWQKPIEGEVSLVQGGDVDGDGQTEVVALSASWALFLLKSDGKQIWQKDLMTAGHAPAPPLPGQLIVHDLDGDGQMEIVAVAPPPAAAVHVFAGDGSEMWRYPLGDISTAAGLTAGDINGDGKAELVVTGGQKQVYLLDTAGHRLAAYLTEKTSGALDYADLNGDGLGEVIVGLETGVQVFGASPQAGWREVWQSPLLGLVTALHLADLDGDGQDEVVAGSYEGQVYALADDGHMLWNVPVETPVLALGVGDVDGDGRPEVVVASYGGRLHLLNGNRPVWSVRTGGGFVTGLVVHDLDGDSRAEIMAGVGVLGMIMLLDGEGRITWEREFGDEVTAIGSDGGQILVGLESGRVYHLRADGSPAGEYDLGAKVLSLGEGLAATADGRVHQLGPGEPAVIRELGAKPWRVQLSAETMVMHTGSQQVSLVANDGTVWQRTMDSPVLRLAAGDLNGDEEVEIAVTTDSGRVHLFASTLDQPPMLAKPGLTETRTGYTYSVNVNDPDGDTVTATLEIWDPSAGVWLTQATQSLALGQGRLSWNTPDPFDTWDSGRESRFRFHYDDGRTQRVTPETKGPLTIPTSPWYIHYGQRLGLGAIMLLVPAMAWALYRRQQAYRRSPLGRAEAFLKKLRAQPDEALPRLHDLARNDPTLLAYLPSLAREAGEPRLANWSEGFQLILTRPEVAVEGLRLVVSRGAEEQRSRRAGEIGRLGDEEIEGQEATEQALEKPKSLGVPRAGEIPWPDRHDRQNPLAYPPGQAKSKIQNRLYELFLESLEANTVARIVSLQARLADKKEFTVVTTSVVHLSPATTEVVTTIGNALANLGRVAQTLRNYERVETVEDKVAYLAEAIETLGRLDREFQTILPQPERNILSRIAFNWLTEAANALQDLQGRAQIEVALKTRQLLSLKPAMLCLELTNTGRSPASNLTISLIPDQLYAVGNGATYLDILPAGRSVVVELPISAAPSVDQFRAEFTITFDDRERSGKNVAFADLVRLLKPAVTFRPAPNPYAPGTPLRPGSPIFFGRDDLFQFIAETMGGLARQNILVLIGQRRMGKTSFLQQLPARLGQEYLPVYLDGQSLGIDAGMANFFYDLALAIADALADQGIQVAEPELQDFRERPSGAFERSFLPTVFEAIGQRQLLLLFDEFEELEMRVASGKLEPTIFPFFRHLMQHGDKLGFIFVGTHRLEELTASYWSILFNIALYKRVTFLSEAAARALIIEPVAAHGLLYDDLALDKILRVTAGHPYFLQLICHALVNRANREKRGYLTIQDVNDTLGELVELGEAHFAFLWEQSSPPEQLTMAGLMRLLAQTPTVTTTQIVELLAERRAALEARQVREALRRLIERDIVREIDGSPPRYEYKVDLVRLWVERYKALGRVIEEVRL